MATLNLTKSNRAVGLMNELAALIAEEDGALELHRIAASLRSLSHEARSKAQAFETTTQEIAKAARKQTVSRQPMSKRVSSLLARC